jgi:hypothetical protein
VIDLSLSSDIALSFAFNGLVDLGILGETRRSFAVQLFTNFIAKQSISIKQFNEIILL